MSGKRPISRLLVANRGEIAVRIIRACRELGIETVLAASEADGDSLPARLADRTLCIGPPAAAASYLRPETIVCAAVGSGCQAIHPGYGFLAEQPALADLCAQSDVVFVGPTADQLRQLGDKLAARELAQAAGVAVVPGRAIDGEPDGATFGEQHGYPLLLKAAAGGGGIGIHIVADRSQLGPAFDLAAAQARTAFGDDRLYVERYVAGAKHVEVQVLGDGRGSVVQLGERDCSVQRRYQKLIEESPCAVMPAATRARLCAAAVRLAKGVAYRNAGTVEFLFDRDSDSFYFLEVNARIQVEHPVTEAVTGVDLVMEQIRLAGGDSAGLEQAAVRQSGHAIECRINAESPAAGFRPSPGRITAWHLPTGDHLRVDTHCYEGYFVPPYYDSLLAKVITWGADRPQAIGRMREALEQFTVEGVETNLQLQQRILAHSEFQRGAVTTRWLEHELHQLVGAPADPSGE